MSRRQPLPPERRKSPGSRAVHHAILLLKLVFITNKGARTLDTQPWLAELHSNGYRLTAPRRAVVETVVRSPRALTPLQVYERARRRYHALGLVSVYRTLEKLEQLGLVQRVHQPQGCQAFIAAGHGHQHMLLCQRCGRVTYFEGDDLDDLIGSLASRTGYKIRGHWLQLFGLCASCQ